MTQIRGIVVSLVVVLAVGCGGKTPNAAERKEASRLAAASASSAARSVSPTKAAEKNEPDAAESSMLAEFGDLEYTKESTAFAGPALTREEYTRQVNAGCADLKAHARATLPDAKNPDPDEIAEWTTSILKKGGETYHRIAALRPPAEMEAGVINQFLKAYYEQLHAAESMFIESLGNSQQPKPEVMDQAMDAKARLNQYAEQHGLTECVQ